MTFFNHSKTCILNNPSSFESFPGKFTSSPTQSSQNQELTSPDFHSLIQPSLTDMVEEPMLSNPYFQPRTPAPTPIPSTGAGAAETAAIQQQQKQQTAAETSEVTMTLTAPQIPYQNDLNQQLYDTFNKVENINKRLRKVESYLGFRPDNTI